MALTNRWHFRETDGKLQRQYNILVTEYNNIFRSASSRYIRNLRKEMAHVVCFCRDETEQKKNDRARIFSV